MKEDKAWLAAAKKLAKKNKFDSVKTGELMKLRHLCELYTKYAKEDGPVKNEDRHLFNGND